MSQLKIKDGNSWVAIPAGGVGVPSGGTAGQYLKKSSSVDYATEWATNSWELLWTNPSPSSSFDGQTVSLNLSSYSEVFIRFQVSTSTFGESGAIPILSPIHGMMVSATLCFNDSGATSGFKRNFTPSSSGIVFDKSYAGSRWATETNSTMIPTHIYAR